MRTLQEPAPPVEDVAPPPAAPPSRPSGPPTSTTGKPPDRGPVAGICWATGACGLLALMVAATAGGARLPHLVLFAGFCLELGITQVIPVRIAHRGEGEELTLEEAFLVPMALLLSPLEVVIALGLAATLSQLLRRVTPEKGLFNVGHTMVAAALGVGVYRSFAGSLGVVSARSVVAAVAGGFAYALGSSLLVSAVIAASQRVRFRAIAFEGMLLRTGTWAGALSFGVLITLSVMRYPWSPVLTLGPILALQLGYVGAVEQRRERHRVEGLYRLAADLRSGIDEDDILQRLVPAARGLLEAQAARLVDFPVAGPGLLHAEVRPGLVIELDRQSGRAWTRRDQQLANAIAEGAGVALEKARLFHEVKHQALYDPLTGLPNQVLFADRVGHALALAERSGERLAVLFLDLDHFKRVNDTLGHHVGNVLLQSVAQRVSSVIRSGDTLARMGGDEFTLLMPVLESVDDACAVADKIAAVLRQPFTLADHRVFCGASIGIALYPDHASHVSALLQKSDLAMYQAKTKRRGTYRIYAPCMGAETHARIELESDLRKALEDDQLRVVYQPQVELASGRIVGVEALVRWQHPTQGLLGPDRFIPLAEDSGLVEQVDRWVLRTVCAQARRWERNGMPGLRVAVNLSGAELGARGLAEGVLATMEEGELPASRLEIEVTESVAVQEGGDPRTLLEELRGHGIALAIDDFGTGYSTLARLSTFPVDTLKIDRSFIEPIGRTTDDAPLVVAIIAMAHSLKLSVVAEGVERVEQLRFLREQGCDRAQGFLLGRPVFGPQVERLVAEGLAALRLTPLSEPAGR